MSDKKTCETCWHWSRIVHPLDFELGRCGLFEREMNAQRWCDMWEAKAGEVIAFPTPASMDVQKPD